MFIAFHYLGNKNTLQQLVPFQRIITIVLC